MTPLRSRLALLSLHLCLIGSPIGSLMGCDAGVNIRPNPDGAIGDAGTLPDAMVPDSQVILQDGSVDAAMPDAGPPPPSGPVLYVEGPRHSPITADLASGLRAIAARGPSQSEDVLSKIGDSITVSSSFLQCFAGTRVDLDGRDALGATIDHFLAGDAGGTDPYRRTSLCATVGWSASAAVAGTPAPIDQELAAIDPRFAVVMYGTNDSGFRSVEAYARDMMTIVDRSIARGVIPVLTSIPPRDDSASADAQVPLYNLAVRAIAQGRGVPFVDFHRELVPLAGHGLAGDGVHLAAHASGSCVLTPAGLQYGANVRNLLTIEELDRARRALGGETLDIDAPRLRGDGSPGAPFEIDALPFAVLADTRASSHRDLDVYSCSTADESGPELRYRLVLDAPASVTALAVSMTGADVDIHILGAGGTPADCLARDNRIVTLNLVAGAYYVIADTFVSGGVEQAGEVLVLVRAS